MRFELDVNAMALAKSWRANGVGARLQYRRMLIVYWRLIMIGNDASSEQELWMSLERILASTGTKYVVDVGANEGQFILKVGEIASISALCVEPGPDAFLRLIDNVGQMANIKAIQVAVAEEGGDRAFFLSESDVGSSLLRPVADPASQWARTIATSVVRTERLDVLLGPDETMVDLLKVDTQGTDLGVLRSAGGLLVPARIRAVLVEVNFHSLYEHQDSFSDIISFMDSRGYFLAEIFRYYNRLNWLWYADALFLPRSPEYAT